MLAVDKTTIGHGKLQEVNYLPNAEAVDALNTIVRNLYSELMERKEFEKNLLECFSNIRSQIPLEMLTFSEDGLCREILNSETIFKKSFAGAEESWKERAQQES